MSSNEIIYYLLYLSILFYLPTNALSSKEGLFRIRTIHLFKTKLPIFYPSDCPSKYFKCGDGTCISYLFLCDGEADCPNSADEDCNGSVHKKKNLNCEEGKFSCPGIDICLPNKWKCDGHRDCPNGFDENNCTSLVECKGFRCNSGECIPNKWKCDGTFDCLDGINLINYLF